MDIPKPRYPGAVFHSEKLAGFQYHCSMSKCRFMDTSTGWLLYHGSEIHPYSLEFECPSDGVVGRWSRELQPIIEQVVQEKIDEGFDLENAKQRAKIEAQRAGLG
ncbi:MAG: hypothetical protein JNM55_16435 [Anaerolineales bacterium]|nr:hypothetical protein [Anaerolineales bacterium]